MTKITHSSSKNDSPAHQRYTAEKRWEKNKEKKIKKHQKTVERKRKKLELKKQKLLEKNGKTKCGETGIPKISNQVNEGTQEKEKRTPEAAKITGTEKE